MATPGYYVVGVSEFSTHPDSFLVDSLKQQMKGFECDVQSSTIERFVCTDQVYLKEKCGESRTYVMYERPDGESEPVLLGFFTLGVTSLQWETVENSDYYLGLNNKQKKHLTQFLYGRRDHIGLYTIGELARAKSTPKEKLPGAVILKEALDMVKRAQQIAGGRFVLVDSLPVLYERLYKGAGFEVVDEKKVPGEKGEEDCYVSLLPVENIQVP